jgi:hypothetical protein
MSTDAIHDMLETDTINRILDADADADADTDTIDSEMEEVFHRCADALPSHLARISDADKLRLYGLYKQALEGNVRKT